MKKKNAPTDFMPSADEDEGTVSLSIGGETAFEGTGKEFNKLVSKFEDIADKHGIPRKHAHAAAGHNRVGGVAVDQLKSIIARVEQLEAEKANTAADIKEVFAEAKGNGFSVQAIRSIIKMRKMDAQELEEQETVLDTYRRALGMLPQLDMFDEEEEASDDQ